MAGAAHGTWRGEVVAIPIGRDEQPRGGPRTRSAKGAGEATARDPSRQANGGRRRQLELLGFYGAGPKFCITPPSLD